MAPPLKKFLRQGNGLLSRLVRCLNQGRQDGRIYHGKPIAEWVRIYEQLAEAMSSLPSGSERKAELEDAKAATIEVFREIGPPAVKALRHFVSKPLAGDLYTWTVITWAIEALGRLGPLATDAGPAIASRLERRSLWSRIRGSEDIVAKVIRQGKAAVAAKAHGQIRDPRTIHALRKALNDVESFEGDQRIIQALAKIGTKAALDVLVAALKTDQLDSRIRGRIATILAAEWPDQDVAQSALNRIRHDDIQEDSSNTIDAAKRRLGDLPDIKAQLIKRPNACGACDRPVGTEPCPGPRWFDADQFDYSCRKCNAHFCGGCATSEPARLQSLKEKYGCSGPDLLAAINNDPMALYMKGELDPYCPRCQGNLFQNGQTFRPAPKPAVPPKAAEPPPPERQSTTPPLKAKPEPPPSPTKAEEPQLEFIRFRCTQCRKLLKATRQQIGRKAKCTQCKSVLVITDPAAPAETQKPAVPPRTGRWSMVAGYEAKQLAVQHQVVRPSDNFDAVVLTYSIAPVPGQVGVAGAVQCHACGREVKFQKDFVTSGLSASRETCPGCRSEVALMCTAGEKDDGCFLVASPGTQPIGSVAAPVVFRVTRVDTQAIDSQPLPPPAPLPLPPLDAPPAQNPKVGKRNCSRCEAGLTWWSRKMLSGAFGRPGVNIFGSFGGVGEPPPVFVGVCPAYTDGYCSTHARSGTCPVCRRPLEQG